MGLYDKYKTDPDKEASGVWLDEDRGRILQPDEVEAFLGDPTRSGVLLGHAHTSNKRYTKTLDELRPKYGSMTLEQSREVTREAFSRSCVLGWKGPEFVGPDGAPLSFSPERAALVTRDLPQVYERWSAAATDFGAFRAKQLEEEAKNS